MIDNMFYKFFGMVDNFMGYLFDRFVSDDHRLKKKKRKK
jgi:hypothetical protein